MKKLRLISLSNLSLLLVLIFVGVSCSDSSTGAKNKKQATFKGKVENSSAPATAGISPNAATTQSSGTVKGAVITAAAVQSDGSLKTIGSSHTTTNAQGEYTLKVDVSGVSAAAKNRIVIIAENNNHNFKAFVASKVQNGGTFTVQPITLESSAEADVYQKVTANGNNDEVSKADIEIAVGANVAAEIEGNAQKSADVAASLASYAKAKAKFYARNNIKVTAEQQQKIKKAAQNAELTFSSKLNAAASQKARQNAFNAFMNDMANAELQAGIKAWAVAESDNFAAHVLLNSSTKLSANAQNEIRKYVYFYTATAEEAAVKAQAKAAGASGNTIHAIVQAGNVLQASIKSSSDATENAVASAFAKFSSKVQTAVKSDNSLNGSVFVTSNTTINASGGLKSALESTLSSSGSMNAMLNAYAAFSSGVKSMVKTNLASAGDAKVKAYTYLLVLINLAS